MLCFLFIASSSSNGLLGVFVHVFVHRLSSLLQFDFATCATVVAFLVSCIISDSVTNVKGFLVELACHYPALDGMKGKAGMLTQGCKICGQFYIQVRALIEPRNVTKLLS